MSDKTQLLLAQDWFRWGRPNTAFRILEAFIPSIQHRVRDAFEDEDVEGAVEEIDRITKSM